MKRATLEQHLAEHYGGAKLSDASAARLASLARVSETGARRGAVLGPWRYAIAACLGLLVVSVSLQVMSLTRRLEERGIRSGHQPGSGLLTNVSNPSQMGSVAHADAAPRLVAMQFYLEGCPYTEATTPVFAELEDKYGNRDVIFTRYDISDPHAAERSAKLARAIGVDGRYEGLQQSGVIELVDRETGEVIAEMHRRDERPRFEQALAAALPK